MAHPARFALLPTAPRALQRLRAVILCGALFSFGLPALAQHSTSSEIDGVVELFTSQGCVNCPPADTVLSALARNKRLLALSYHVEYWDYIGWKDPLGSAHNTARQRAYANAMGQRSVYTPQLVLNGDSDLAASDEKTIESALTLDRLNDPARPIELSLTKTGETLHISAQAPDAVTAGRRAVLVLVTYRGRTETDVERGENAGRQLISSHAVRDWQIVGQLNEAPIELDMPISTLTGTLGEATDCAVLLQIMQEDGSPGAILAAAKLPL